MAKTKRSAGGRAMPATPPPNVSAHLNALVEDLRQLVPRALRSWDATAIHHSRVSTRRLKAALDVMEPVLRAARRRRFAKTLRRLRQALGPLRDIDVMLGHLDELRTGRAGRAHACAIAWLSKQLLRRRLDQRRECTREHPPKAILDGLGVWWGLEQDVAEVEQAARSLLRTTAPTQLQAFATRADQLARNRARGAARRTAQSEPGEDVHALRISGKLLRYTLELATPAGYAMPDSVLRSFKKLQDALGAWHDYIVLSETALRRALKAELPAHRGELFGEVLSLSQTLWRASERELDKFCERWDSSGKSIKDSIAETFNAPDDTSASVPAAAEPVRTAPPREVVRREISPDAPATVEPQTV